MKSIICKVCYSENIISLYQAKNLPIFQNKVFDSADEARAQKTGNINLVQCMDCGFIFNAEFDANLMTYDNKYQNEQGYSSVFIAHLNYVMHLLGIAGYKHRKIIEIGCGKGMFLDMLKRNGFSNVIGFDPAYEGDDIDIVKDYFCEKYKDINADLIILRHVLEHIEYPFEFLRSINNATDGANIYIEVPDFNWISRNRAFWDIYYEHCNYLNNSFLSDLFYNGESFPLFGKQYTGILDKLKNLKIPSQRESTFSAQNMTDSIIHIKKFIESGPIVIWGAASKTVTLLNLLDRDCQFVKYCVDINPAKQGKYIATTGHKIEFPEKLLSSQAHERVLIMNENYYDEIVSKNINKNLSFYSLEGI